MNVSKDLTITFGLIMPGIIFIQAVKPFQPLHFRTIS